MSEKHLTTADPVLPTETVRVTTTYAKAQAIRNALQYFVSDRGRAEESNPTLAEALRDVNEGLGGPERIRQYRQRAGDLGFAAPVEPVRAGGGMHDDYDERHPAYAMIGASRSQGRVTLAGSDFEHQNFMTVRIKNATRVRGLSSDRWHADREIVEVCLSEAQWATFVSATNVGDGVACTLLWTREEGYLPAIKRTETRREEALSEVQRDLAEAVAALDDMLADERLPKWAREKATRAKARLTDGVPFVLNSADEHIENTVEHAKIEVDAWVTGAVQRAGLQALGGYAPIRMIGNGLPEEPTR